MIKKNKPIEKNFDRTKWNQQQREREKQSRCMYKLMDDERARIAKWNCEISYKILQWCWCCLFRFVWSKRALLPKKQQQQSSLEDIYAGKKCAMPFNVSLRVVVVFSAVACQWTELSHFNEQFRTHNVFMRVCSSVDFQFIAMLILENLSLWMSVNAILTVHISIHT